MGTARRLMLWYAISVHAMRVYVVASASLCAAIAAIVFEIPNSAGFFQFAFAWFLAAGIFWFISYAVYVFARERSAKSIALKDRVSSIDSSERASEPRALAPKTIRKL